LKLSSDNHQPPQQPSNSSLRLNKSLALYLGVSRREADDMIAAGRVKVGESTAALGQRFSLTDRIFVDGTEVKPKNNFTYLILNKPTGYVSSRGKQGDAPTIYELLPKEYRALKTAGRLDKDSSGLIMLSDDGDWILRMTHPRYNKIKIYEIELDKSLEPLHQQMIADFGVDLPDGKSKLGLTKLDTSKNWQVTMSEGRNRQIRRTFGTLGYTVTKLNRTNFGNYSLGDLKPGEWEEIQTI
jgi:23S rRNA pseudouridine2605 synthase